MRASALLSLFPLILGCPQPKPPHARDAHVGAAGPGARADAGPPSASSPAPRAEDPCASLTAEQRELLVATVDQQRLTLCDFARRVYSDNPFRRARFNAPEQRRALLDSWVTAELLASEARARHLDDAPEVRRAIALQMARRLELLTRNAVAQPTVSDAEVRAYFDAHHTEYETPAQVRLSQIVLATRADADRVLAEARAHESDDAYFRQLVQRASLDLASRQIDGDLGFVGESGSENVAPEVARAGFALVTNGQIADHVIESAHGGPRGVAGFHVVRLTARRDSLHRTLEDESRRIRTRLERDKLDQLQEAAMRALVTRLRTGASVQIDEAALASVRVETPDAGAAPVPGMLVPPVRLESPTH